MDERKLLKFYYRASDGELECPALFRQVFAIWGEAPGEALELLGQAKMNDGDINHLIHLLLSAICSFRLSHFEQGIAYTHTMLTLAQRMNCQVGIADAYLYLGMAYASQGDYKKACIFLEDARFRLGRFEDHRSLFRVLMTLANIHSDLGDHGEALNLRLAAMNYIRIDPHDPVLLNCFLNIATNYFRMEDYKTGKAFLDEVENALKEKPNKILTLMFLAVKIDYHYCIGDKEAAISDATLFLESLDVKMDKVVVENIRILHTLLLFSIDQDVDEKQTLEFIWSFLESIETPFNKCIFLRNIARELGKKGVQHTNVIVQISKKGLEIAEMSGHLHLAVDFHLILHEVFQTSGDEGKSVAHQRASTEIKRRLSQKRVNLKAITYVSRLRSKQRGELSNLFQRVKGFFTKV